MDENSLLLTHNLHRQDAEKFADHDPHLSKLNHLPYTYKSKLLQQLPQNIPGIFTLTGGGLVGKTTLLKQWVQHLIINKTLADDIVFYSGEWLDDFQKLIDLVQIEKARIIIIDEVTHIQNWEKAIKFFVDTGITKQKTFLLASSNKTLHKKIALHFPNPYDHIKKTDFYLNPLSFHEFITLKHPTSETKNINLSVEFEQYLLHGGYLIAINDIANNGLIQDETLKSYAAWLRREIQDSNKQEFFLLEIVTGIVSHYNSPVTWNMLSKESSIDHPKTISDYINLLESLSAVYVQPALIEEKLSPAPKKARKIMFCDPFIFHSIKAWLSPGKNVFKIQIQETIDDIELCSKLVKACVTTHYEKYYPTYYIKAEGEIDLAYIWEQRFWPIIIIWTNQLRAKDLKQIMKYPNGKILTKTMRSGAIEHIRTEPLPQALLKLGE